MSTRQLRKLQKQRELEQAKLKAEAAEEEEESEDEPVSFQNNKGSLFANLAALEDEGADEEDEAEDNAVKSREEEEEAPVAAPKKAKKSKKRKKAKKGKPSDALQPTVQEETGPDEIDAALEALNISRPTAESTSASDRPIDPNYERICALLGINTQHLKVANEMRNLFGREAIQNNDDAGGAIPRGARRRDRAMRRQVDLETALKGHHPPGKGLPEMVLRRNPFIQGKDDWPKATTGGLTVGVDADGQRLDGTVLFKFNHEIAYQSVQRQFHIFVEVGSPENLIGLLQRNPYNISLLIQVSKIAKNQSDNALAFDLLERALFTFGRATTSLFHTKLAQGKARLDFRYFENREFWLAGYHYIKGLFKKGTYRTALEWAKLLLSLDPVGDPYCMGFVIHHFALRAFEPQFLLDFAQEPLKKEQPHWLYTSPSLALAALQLRDGAKSRELLEKSMNRIPWLFESLFRELKLDPPRSIWGQQPRSKAEELFTQLYVAQCHDLWNTPEATSLLMEIASAVPKINATTPVLSDKDVSLDLVRHLYLEENTNLMALAPSAMLHRSNNSDSDPLPPDNSLRSYSIPTSDQQSSADNSLYHPFAALARLLPGWRDGNIAREDLERQMDDGSLRERLEAEIAEEDADESTGAGAWSLARTLLDVLWPHRSAPITSSDHSSDEEWASLPDLEAAGDAEEAEYEDARQDGSGGEAR
ncbi:transcriptional repressor TCF25-domain-containing protein [Xylogone sp. PMI_703]|nr:transcriptional repressor TCF25-domain-containing protein [Xylogone sp. PMI_703]